MPIIIVQAAGDESSEELGKAIIDLFAARGYEPRKCAVIFQPNQSSFFSVDTGYVSPETVSSVRFAGTRHRTSSGPAYNKNELTEKVMKIMVDRKNTSMVDMSYALNISNEEWAGRALREIFTDLEQTGAITKSGEKRGTRYILVEKNEVVDA